MTVHDTINAPMVSHDRAFSSGDMVTNNEPSETCSLSQFVRSSLKNVYNIVVHFLEPFFFFVFSSNQKWFRWRFTNVNSLHQQRRMKERRVWKAIFGKCWPSTGGQWHKQQSPDHGPTQNNHDWEFIGRLHKWMDAHACSWGLNKHLNAIFQQALATKHIVFVFYIVEKNKKEQFRAAHIKNLRMKKKKMRDKQKWNENLPCAVPTHWSRNDANLHWHSAHKHWGYTGPNSNSLSVNLIFFRSNKETK